MKEERPQHCADSALRYGTRMTKGAGLRLPAAGRLCATSGPWAFQDEMEKTVKACGRGRKPGERAGAWPEGQVVENKAHKDVLELVRYCGTIRETLKYVSS